MMRAMPRHVFVDVTLPPGMTLHFGGNRGSRTFETPIKVRRCEWCGVVEGTTRRSRRCYGQPVQPGAALFLPQAAPEYAL